MTFLRINGWKIPCTTGRGATEATRAHGELRESRWTGRPSRNRGGLPREWQASAFPMTQEEADTLEALVMGRGHAWRFLKDPFSFSGIGPESIQNANQDLNSDVPGMLGEFNDETQATTFDCGLRPDCWTVLYVWDTTQEDAAHIHKAVRSDGAKWENGVRNDALDTSELTVSPPAIAIDAQGPPYFYTDLVVLPFAALDAFIEQNYLWRTGWQQTFRAPLAIDAEPVTSPEASLSSFTGSIVDPDEGRVQNEFGDIGAARFDTTDVADYGTAVATRTTAKPEVSWECWAYFPTALASVSPGYLFSRTDGTFTAGYLIGHFGFFGGVADWGVLFARTAAGFPGTSTTNAPIALDTWYHLVATWREADGRFRLYRDGQLETSISETLSASPLANDNAMGFGVGNDVFDLGDPSNAHIQEARFYDRELTLEEVRERYEAGLRFSRSFPGPRYFSELPRLEVFGDALEGEVLEVMGDMRSAQGVVQHAPKQTAGGAGGWANNNRAVPFELHEVRPRGRDAISPRPTSGWLFDERQLVTSTTLRAAQGVLGGNATLVGTQVWEAGPFGFGRSRDHQNNTALRTLLPVEVNQLLNGIERVSVAAWVKRDLASTIDIILDLERATSAQTRLQLRLNSANTVNFGGQSGAADAFIDFAGSETVPVGRWMLVGGTLDLNDPIFKATATAGDARINTFFWEAREGLRYQSSGELVFTNNVFDAADFSASGDNLVGVDQAITDPFAGNIAAIYIFQDHVLKPSEVARLGELGFRGVLR